MMNFIKQFLVLLLMGFFASANAQTFQLQGVVFHRGSNSRIAGAMILNVNTSIKASTDKLGIFQIAASVGDTLDIRCIGYESKKVAVKSSEDIFISLEVFNRLTEVNIYGRSLVQELREVEEQFRSKGIYYKGKPPLKLLSPLGGSPLTFFHELLSKDGKRARRFANYAEAELEYHDVAIRFNDRIIRNTVPISDGELLAFKTAFWPKAEQVRSWSDFDLLNYIKESYRKFNEEK